MKEAASDTARHGHVEIWKVAAEGGAALPVVPRGQWEAEPLATVNKCG